MPFTPFRCVMSTEFYVPVQDHGLCRVVEFHPMHAVYDDTIRQMHIEKEVVVMSAYEAVEDVDTRRKRPVVKRPIPHCENLVSA